MPDYLKQTYDFFRFQTDQKISGVNGLGDDFSVQTKNIQNGTISWANQILGDKLPTWRSRIATGADATTAMTATQVTAQPKFYQLSLSSKSVSGHPRNYSELNWVGGFLLASIPPAGSSTQSFRDHVRNRALRSFISRAQEVRSSIEGGQSLGEWKQTIGAITNPLGAMRRFVFDHVSVSKKRYRRTLNRSGPKAAAKLLGDTYLEFQFGWLPLAKDVGAAIGGLMTRYDQPDEVIVKGQATDSYDSSTSIQDVVNHWAVQVCRDVQTYSTYSVRYRASIRTGAVEGVKRRTQVLGLTPDRFVPTVWELIPYSFVVDYFVNIGDIIESYAFQRSSIAWGHQTVRDIATRKYGPLRHYFTDSVTYPTTRQLLKADVYGGDATMERKTVTRTPIGQVSLIPTLEFTFPIRTRPWLNMAALLAQALRP
jgi:hypothetical protein